MKYKSILILLSFLIAVCPKTNAEPAFPGPINMHQPDGSSLTVLLKGDEFFAYNTTIDGYLITQNQKGLFEYANVDAEGKIVAMGVRVRNINERSAQELQFIESISKEKILQKLSETFESNISKSAEVRAASSVVTKSMTGNKRVLCILMSFPDRPFEKTQNEFHNLMNQSGYSEGNAIGSVRDFYLENSYNQLNLNITVVGPYTANYNMVYYGGNINNIRGNDIRPQDLIKEALAKANPDVNYADFDSDNDGVVDAVHVIYAGYAESAGGPAESIWPHKWTLSNVSYDGKRITAYSCSSELRWSSGSKIAAIGTTCHELGHVFGAPDFYDTNTRDLITWLGTSSWDLMAIGNWNNGGDWPAHHNPYTKSQIFGWSEIKNFPADNTLITLNPASASNNSFYRLNTSTPNEYFIIENRQPVGFDMGLPGHGMLVYHVHSQFDPNSQDNNITHPQRFYPICASAAQNPTNTPASYGDINSGGCPFPGTFNRRSLTFNTMPSLRSWAGANTRKNIQFITETGNNITFVVNPTISGPSNICDQATYTIENLPAGTPLAWSVSSDIRVISEQNTSIIVERDPTLLYMYPTSYILVDIGEPINMILEHNLIVWKGGINETTDLIDISSSPDEYGNPYIHTAQLKGDMLYSGLKESPQWSVSEGLNLTFTDGTMMQFEGYLSQGKYIAVELINPCDEATQIVHRFNNNMSEYSSPDLSILVRHSQFKILDKFRNNTRTEKK